MKSLLILLLSLTMALTMAACSSDGGENTTPSDEELPKQLENEEPAESDGKDAPSKVPAPNGNTTSALLGNASVGEIVKFGSYEQDNNPNNGKEEIEWQVLDVKGGKALLISKYCLDAKTYNTEYAAMYWENCTLRAWLNNEFLNEAFDSSERSAIVESTIQNPDNEEYDTDGGNDTKDRVFLLSIDEARKYFADDEARRSAPTEYAKANGVYYYDYYHDGYETSWWWLRSPGSFQYDAAGVGSDGSISDNGDDVVSGDDAVRPALWVELNNN